MSEAAVGRQYRKELAREKSHIYRKPRISLPTALEIAAGQWQAEHERAKQPQPTQPEKESFLTPVSGASAGSITQPPVRATVGWAQFNPWRSPEEEKKSQEPKSVNTITIFCLAKKIMAQEWRRAKGIKRRDPRAADLEKLAKEYKVRKMEREQEERRQAIELERERRKILDCLGAFVDSALDKRQRKRITSLEQAGDLMAEAFSGLGEVFDVEWPGNGGCTLWLEPWPERRERRARGGVRPALRRVSLDAKLNLLKYERVTDPAVRQEKQGSLLLQPLRLSAREIRKLRTPQQARDFLAEKTGEVGRILGITSENGTWKVRIQPWDEIRRHNLNKSSKEPIAVYELTVSKDLQTLSCKCVED